MNAERLLELYEQISEAPDAIARLRRFVLDLAVRGKLVEQDASDETVKLPSEKRLVSPIKPVPSGWAASTIGQVLNFQYGKGKKKSERLEQGPIPVFGSNGVVGFSDEPLTDNDAIIIGRKGSAGALNLCIGPSWTTDVAYFVEAPAEYQIRYLLLTLKSLGLDALGKGVKPGLSRADAYPLEIHIPPLAEQHRIVAKVDELMALCDRLEEARKTREEVRDKLTAASLARLTAPDTTPQDFPAHARFALKALPALTTRPNQIKTLRQTILNLAVRGKLVEQDPRDEPASEFLQRIADIKAQLLRDGEIKRQKTLPSIDEAQMSFGLPEGWAWVRLGDLSQFVTSGSRDWAKFYSNEGAIFVRMGNLSKDHYKLRLDNIQRVNPPDTGEGTRTRLERGDILISITGDVGMLGLIPENFGDAFINQHTALVRPMGEMKGRYLPELFRSPFAQDQFNAPQRGIKNSFRLTDVTQFVVPLPPLAEQHRIVAKVDALMALCDRLEAALTTTDTTRTRLLESLLHEALEPAADALEAAE